MPAPYDPPVKGKDYLYAIALQDMANPGSFKAVPTIAAGDFKVSTDGSALANLATLPTNTPSGSIWLQVAFSSGEMNGDVVQFQAIDQTATKEWADYAECILTVVKDLTSGSVYLASGSVFLGTFASGVLGVSGGFPILGIGSGSIQPDGSGAVTVAVNRDKTGYALLSGILSGQLVMAASGVFGTTSLNSGQFVNVYSGQLSGQQLNLLSGNTIAVLSGTKVNIFSGSLSGQQVDANVTKWLNVQPNALLASGRIDAAYSLRTGLARSGTIDTIQLDAGTPTESGVFNNAVIVLNGGSGIGQSRMIRFYSASGIATVSPPWEVAPDVDTLFTIIPTTLAASGITQIASGTLVNVYSGQLSGQQMNLLSGNTVRVLSGTQVNVFSGQLSGQQVNLLSGNQTQVWSGTFVNVFSGQLSGQVVDAASGLSVIAVVYSGQLSGQLVNLLSGNQVQVWSGTFVNVFSGQLSGQVVVPASGAFGTASLNSGQQVLIYSGQLSGQQVNLLSGNQVGVWSGTNVNVFSGALSGQLVSVPSGLFTNASLNSGQQVLMYSGQLSGQLVTVPSGLFTNASLNSGQLVNVYSGQLSGQQVNLSSGNTVALLSGSFANVFSGQINAQVWDQDGGIESGLTQRQAMRITVASCAGETSGAGTTTFRIRNAVADFKTRITGTIDSSGNRTSIAYDLT